MTCISWKQSWLLSSDLVWKKPAAKTRNCSVYNVGLMWMWIFFGLQLMLYQITTGKPSTAAGVVVSEQL